MDADVMAAVEASFTAFHDRFGPLFGRPETRQRSAQYLRGLLVQHAERRSAENLAEAVDGATPRALQRFLTVAPWDADAVVSTLQAVVGERLSDGTGVFILDETGFAKQGTRSVGVARQYCGTLGKVANCQIGVFLGYSAPGGHALVDRRLYLPRAWTEDPARCAAAGVPAGTAYQSKTDLGLALLAAARDRGHLAGSWVVGDDEYGKSPPFRAALAEAGWWYVLDVPAVTPFFPDAVAAKAVAVRAVAAALPADAWQRLTVAEGAQGPRQYEFAAVDGWESWEGARQRAGRLVCRRKLDGSEPRYAVAHAPVDIPLATLVAVSGQRWSIETEFQTQKEEVGLDEYEVRGWDGWYHHITMALLAGLFLLCLQQDWGGKGAAADAAAGDAAAAAAVAAAGVDAGRPGGSDRAHPTPQRRRQARPRQAPRQVAA